MTQSERTESGHGGWWGWGKARFWRRFDDRTSNNLMLIPLTRWFEIVLTFLLSSVTAISEDWPVYILWSIDSVCPPLPPPLLPYPTSIVCLLHTPEKPVSEMYAFLNGYPVLGSGGMQDISKLQSHFFAEIFAMNFHQCSTFEWRNFLRRILVLKCSPNILPLKYQQCIH